MKKSDATEKKRIPRLANVRSTSWLDRAVDSQIMNVVQGD